MVCHTGCPTLYLSALFLKTVDLTKEKSVCWYDRSVDFGFLFGARRKQLIGASVHFARHTLPVAMRPARILWHQLIGCLFLVLAVAPARFEYKVLENFKGDARSWTEVAMGGVFIAVMLAYGISSFFKARQISRL